MLTACVNNHIVLGRGVGCGLEWLVEVVDMGREPKLEVFLDQRRIYVETTKQRVEHGLILAVVGAIRSQRGNAVVFHRTSDQWSQDLPAKTKVLAREHVTVMKYTHTWVYAHEPRV